MPVAQADGQHRNDDLLGQQGHVLAEPLQDGAAHSGSGPDAAGDGPEIELVHVGKALQPEDDLLVGQDLAVERLVFGADEGALQHVHDGGFELLVEDLLAAAEVLDRADDGSGVLGGGKAADLQRHRP